MFTKLSKPTRTFLWVSLTSSVLAGNTAFAQTQTNDAQKEPLDEIIVTGSPLSATSGENLSGISVLTNEELARRMSGSLGETLKFEPGISSSFFGAGASRPIIRGQGGLRVLLLDNGIGSIDASAASPDHAPAVEPAMAGRIEVIRGSGLLRYGSAASGGVINVIDGRIPEHVPDKKIAGNARVSASSVDNGIEGAAGADISLGSFGSGDVVTHLEVAHRKTKDYDIPGFARSALKRAQDPLPAGETEDRDTLPNSATEATTLAGGISYIGDKNFMGVAIKDLDSTYGIPGGEGSHIELQQTREDFTSKFDLDGDVFESFSINAGTANYKHAEIEASGDTGTVFKNTGFEVRAEAVQAERGNWQAAHGVQYKKRNFSAIGEESFVPPTTSKQFGLFTFHELHLDPIHLEAALRYEHTKHETASGSADKSYDSLSGSVGADYHFGDYTKFGVTAYRTERTPTTEELFANGPHLATNQFEIGDPNLGKEKATGVEASLRYRMGADHLTINAFYTDYADYIYEAFTGNNRDLDGELIPESQFTASDAVFKGFEVAAKKGLGEVWGLDAAVDGSLEYVRATLDIAGSENAPRIPPFGATFGVNLDADMWGVRAEIDHSSKQNKIGFGELPTEAYTLVNAFVTYDINDMLTLRLSAMNLTDQEARQHTSFLKDVLPLQGRNFKASLSAKF